MAAPEENSLAKSAIIIALLVGGTMVSAYAIIKATETRKSSKKMNRFRQTLKRRSIRAQKSRTKLQGRKEKTTSQYLGRHYDQTKK